MLYIALDHEEAEAIEQEDIYLDTLLAEGIWRAESAGLREACALAADYTGELPLDQPDFHLFWGACDLARPMGG